MKKLMILTLLIFSINAYSQWIDNGTDVTTSNKVGIGTTTPSANLHINASQTIGTPANFNNGFIKISNSVRSLVFDPNQIYASKELHLQTTGDNPLIFHTNETERIRILGNGNVGIGINNPSSNLHIKSDDYNDFIILDRKGRSEVDNLIYLTPSWDSDQNDQLRFNIGTNTIATFEETGNVGIGLVNPTSKLHVFNGGALNMNLQTNSNEAVRLYFTGASQQWSVRKLNNNDFTIVDETSGSKTPFRIEPGAGNNTFRIESNGKVGIGVIDPSEKLEVAGTTKITHTKPEGLRLYHSNASQGHWQSIGSNSNGDLILSAHGTIIGSEHLTVYSNASVGIGTGSDGTGTHKLAVEGTIGAREIKVEATGWSDFVFYNAYNLPSLEEVEKFIAQNNHLPEIPSEAEVLEEGINLGEMNAKLLQKIEELTLYLIEQNKELKAQNEEIKSQNERIVSLEKELKNK